MMEDIQPSNTAVRKGFLEQWGTWISCLFLVAGILAVYWPVIHFEFLNFDDPVYVTENWHLRDGFTGKFLSWAFHTHDGGNWHPLTWISHMLDYQLYGLKPGGHHVTSLLLHIINSCLLFVLLMRMTGRRAASFVVAGLFAWHPLHVESVAWVAERKDVLSTCFGFLTMLAYVGYARKKESKNSKSTAYYCLALFFFALGLMSKPMLVTLPFVLLLLDYWPLQRLVINDASAENQFRTSPWYRLLLEKAPFLIVVAISCEIALWAQKAGHAMVAMDVLPTGRRIANVIMSYYLYIGKTVWPTRLAAFYPYGDQPFSWTIGLAGAALVVISVIAFCLRKQRYIPVGWFWYLGTLVPVIGFVQVGGQAMADRYMYVPAIGLFIIAVFCISGLSVHLPGGKAGATALAAFSLAACLLVTQRQVLYWRNSETLFRHAIAVTERNQAAYINLGSSLASQGRFTEAAECFQQVIRWMPRLADAHTDLADVYRFLNEPADAIAEYQVALRLDPDEAGAHYGIAVELLPRKDFSAAIQHLQRAVAINPNYADAHYQLATALMSQGRVEEALQHYREALRVRPDWVEPLNNLSWELATQPDGRLRNGKEAFRLAKQAVVFTHTNDAGVLDTFAAACAETGQYPEAIRAAQSAARLAEASTNLALAQSIKEHLSLYEKNQPFREPAPRQ
jgi:protein O-mannosyl-transferase